MSKLVSLPCLQLVQQSQRLFKLVHVEHGFDFGKTSPDVFGKTRLNQHVQVLAAADRVVFHQGLFQLLPVM